jgi:hypothetical protein
MRAALVILIAMIVLPFRGHSQAYGQAYVEYGYSIFDYKSDELVVFMQSYNQYFSPASPFDLKVPSAKGDYLKFGLGIGGNVGMVLDMCIYKAESSPMSVRYSNGSGRDISYGLRNTITNVGVRFGGTSEIPVWGQMNINTMIQHVTIKSEKVYPDGSKSLGRDQAMNGVFSDFNLIFGLGASVGFRVIGPLAITASADYIGRGIDSKSHPEYHQFDDNNDVNNSSNYVPRDVGAYYAGSFATENSISNDLRGWKFSFGAVFMISSDM